MRASTAIALQFFVACTALGGLPPATLDPSFATNCLASGPGTISALALQPDGRILLAGSFTAVDGMSRPHVARLLGDKSAPVITTPPASQTAAVGETIHFDVEAAGFAPLFYQWQKGVAPIAGATNATRVLANLRANDAGSYSVVVNNSLGAIASAAASLTVLDLPQITEQPQGRCFTAGDDITLRVGATASTPMRFQWWQDFGWMRGPVTGATNAVLVLSDLQEECRCWAVVSCACGSVTSAVAELFIPRAGGLDPTFNPGSGVGGWVNALAIQPDGRIILGGQFSSVDRVRRANLARLLPNGSVDRSSGLERGADNDVEAVAVQSDGQVLAGGQFTFVHGAKQPCLARIHPDNCVDAALNPLMGGEVVAIAVQSGDKVLVGGPFSDVNGNYAKGGLTRFTADGELDDAFVPSWIWKVNSLALAPDGGFAAGGYAGQSPSQTPRVARCDSDGHALPGFNAPTIQGAWITAVALQSDGKVIIGGSFTNVGGLAITNLARLNTNGTVDASFQPRLRSGQDVFCLAVQSDDRVLVGGRFGSVGAVARQNFARLEASGSVDANYQADANDWVFAVALQPDGCAVIGGYFTQVNGQPRGGVARLLPNAAMPGAPTLTITRTGNSVVVSWPSPSTGWTLQHCGNLAAGGWTTSGLTVSNDGTNRHAVCPPTGTLFFRLAK